MNEKTDIEKAVANIKYLEALQLPKFKRALDRLLNRKEFDYILDCQSVAPENLKQFIERAIEEGNAILVEREYNGYCVVLWKD